MAVFADEGNEQRSCEAIGDGSHRKVPDGPPTKSSLLSTDKRLLFARCVPLWERSVHFVRDVVLRTVMCPAGREGNISHLLTRSVKHHYAARHNITDLRSKSTSLFTNLRVYAIIKAKGGDTLLKLNKSLNYKTIAGKKYRSPFFIPCLIIFIIIFFATLIISSNTIPDTYQGGDRATLVGLLCVVCAGLPFALTICTRHVVCVLSDDRLYFFDCGVTRKKARPQKSEHRGYASGSILYSDIKNIDFFRMKYEYYNHRSHYITPSSIVIHGEGFSVTIAARKSLIKKINEKCNKHIFAISEDQNESPVDKKPQGLWGDILTAFENGKFETIWASDISVEYCSLDIDGEMIDITLDKNDRTICFNLDKDTIYVCYPPSDKDNTLRLSTFADWDALITYMKNCTEKILK